jgi:hypothetical protein
MGTLFIQARSASKGLRAARTSRAKQDWIAGHFYPQILLFSVSHGRLTGEWHARF